MKKLIKHFTEKQKTLFLIDKHQAIAPGGPKALAKIKNRFVKELHFANGYQL